MPPIDFSYEPKTLESALNYNFPNDSVDIYIFTRGRDGRILEVAQPVILSPRGSDTGSQMAPCISIPQYSTEKFLKGLVSGLDRHGITRRMTEPDARVVAQQRHLEDLRHLLKIRAVEKL